jgi:hypothetical protein
MTNPSSQRSKRILQNWKGSWFLLEYFLFARKNHIFLKLILNCLNSSIEEHLLNLIYECNKTFPFKLSNSCVTKNFNKQKTIKNCLTLEFIWAIPRWILINFNSINNDCAFITQPNCPVGCAIKFHLIPENQEKKR